MLIKDNPTEEIRKTLPKGDGSWKGFDHVYGQIAKACYKFPRLSDDHIYYMAVLGCGDEELMKYEMAVLKNRNII